MAFNLPPPPPSNNPSDPAFRDWFFKLTAFLGTVLDLSNVTGILAVENGGTGTSDVPANGELLIGNGTDYTVNTLTAGSNITITNGAGTIEIASSGGGGGALNNVISTPTTIEADTSYPIIQYLIIEDTLTVEGNVLILDGAGITGGGGGSGTVTSVTSSNADITIADTTTTPVITLVQSPALRSASTTVDVSSATAPTIGQVLTATSSTAATWQTPSASGTFPKVGAYQSTNQSFLDVTDTKILFQTEEFDTNNNFSSSRFTPTVAGYYEIGGALQFTATTTEMRLKLLVNGADFKIIGNSVSTNFVAGSALVLLNGSTDYVELWGTNVGTTKTSTNDQTATYFYAFRVN
jgi:hypothetical protein